MQVEIACPACGAEYECVIWATAGEETAAPESQVFADFMRIVLEVINCILTSNLAANPQLVRHAAVFPVQLCQVPEHHF